VSLSLAFCAKMKQIKGTHQTPYARRTRRLFFSSIYGVQSRFIMLDNFKRSNAVTYMQTKFSTGQKRIKSRTESLCL